MGRHKAEDPNSPPSQWLSLNRSDHLVQFYDQDSFLVDSAAAYLAAGLALGEAALVIATRDHRQALAERLSDHGFDAEALTGKGSLILLDAGETLAGFMSGDWPDKERFHEVVGGLVAKTLRERPGLRAFGEMVALLWAEGKSAAAIRLEELWNDLGKSREFSLFCAYPMAAFRGSEHGEAFGRICREHKHILPSGSRPSMQAGEHDLAILQQKAISLDSEIAERKRAEDARLRLAAIVEGSFDAIIGADLDGHITSWNAGAERLFGHAEAEVRGKPISAFVRPENPEEEKAVLARLRAGELIEPFDTVRLRTDGGRLHVSVTVSPIKDAEGRVAGASKIVRDITERRRYEAALADKEDQLRQAQKMEAVGRLAGGIAHDFNNLLTAINGYSEMALAMAEDGTLREFLQEIKRSGDRAASLTQQLLAYSRKQVLAPTVFDINATVGEMERMLRRLIGEDIAIRTELAPDLGLVKADIGQVQQIILNLVLNARDAMPHGGRLTLATANRMVVSGGASTYLEATPGPHAMLAVGDTGLGMDEQLKARIFEPFFTTKEVGKGTGLGLSSVYGILKQSGGGIEVESEPGRGSVFRILLPLATQAEREAAAGRREAVEGFGRGEGTILLVEDEETVRRFVSRTLAARGYVLLEARDGTEALEIGRKQSSIDLLLTDVVMPGMNGGKVAEALRATHPGLRILFMSGYPDNVLQSLPPSTLDARFLQKPFSQESLQSMVREILARPTAGRPA